MGNKVPDSWTAYRLGEALLQEGNYSAAANRFKQAVDQLPLQLDFRFKHASALYLDGQTEDAGKEFLFITRENPGYEKAWMNLAVWYINKGMWWLPKKFYRMRLHLIRITCRPD